MMLAKRYRTEKEFLVAVCDKELLGKTLKEGEFSFYVSPEFYGGEEITEEELKDLLESATIANLIGHRCVSIAIEAGIIDEEMVLFIQGVPHAQMVRML
ncbi:MAG: uncharacterized protein PWR13_1407 [Archaeoglobi archaeon]|nr:DUF424 family protein [Candidatus Mnemosynella bozhongmuii]MDK2782379.1 uncharacterized protein [Archaeoglobi archaeon]